MIFEYSLSFAAVLIVGIPLGLLWGRLLTRIIQQIPLNKPVFGDRTFCHHCHEKPYWSARIPVLGFILEKGRCPHCRQDLELRNFIVEFVTVFVVVLTFVFFSWAQALQLSLMFGLLWAIAWIDWDEWVIPDPLVILVFIAALLGLGLGQVVIDQSLWGLGAMAVFFGFIMGLHWLMFKESGLGWGDAKLGLALSIWLGPFLSVFTFFAATILALIVWIVAGFKLGYSRSRPLQFGPFIALAAMAFGIARAIDPLIITHLLLPK